MCRRRESHWTTRTCRLAAPLAQSGPRHQCPTRCVSPTETKRRLWQRLTQALHLDPTCCATDKRDSVNSLRTNELITPWGFIWRKHETLNNMIWQRESHQTWISTSRSVKQLLETQQNMTKSNTNFIEIHGKNWPKILLRSLHFASLLPSWFSPQHPQVIGTHEFPHASDLPSHCWAHMVVPVAHCWDYTQCTGTQTHWLSKKQLIHLQTLRGRAVCFQWRKQPLTVPIGHVLLAAGPRSIKPTSWSASWKLWTPHQPIVSRVTAFNLWHLSGGTQRAIWVPLEL